MLLHQLESQLSHLDRERIAILLVRRSTHLSLDCCTDANTRIYQEPGRNNHCLSHAARRIEHRLLRTRDALKPLVVSHSRWPRFFLMRHQAFDDRPADFPTALSRLGER